MNENKGEEQNKKSGLKINWTLLLTLGTLISTIITNFFIIPNTQEKIKQLEISSGKAIKELESELKRHETLRENRWQIKRQACFKALNIADAIISNQKYEKLDDGQIKRTYVSTEEARNCINELACACDSNEVLEILKRIITKEPSYTPAIIKDLRNAVRRELNFGLHDFDNASIRSFIGRLDFDTKD